MGLYLRNVKALLLDYPEKLNCQKTITIGRQYLFVPPGTLVNHLRESGKIGRITQPAIETFLKADNFYVDNFLRLLGAESVDSIDYSDYEKATIIHDLNQPLASQHQNKYSLVLDVGTIEHVFNVPEAMKSLMSMVEVGGKLIIVTVGNNQPGHGFYQFSPEFFFRTLNGDNGFRLDKLYIQEAFDGGRAYQIRDTAEMRKRATYCSWAEMEITAIATRTAVTDIFAKVPLQSDYSIVWKGEEKGYVHQSKLTMKMRLLNAMQHWMPSVLHKYYCKRCHPGANQDVYRKMDI
jgi:hypothetical protein